MAYNDCDDIVKSMKRYNYDNDDDDSYDYDGGVYDRNLKNIKQIVKNFNKQPYTTYDTLYRLNKLKKFLDKYKYKKFYLVVDNIRITLLDSYDMNNKYHDKFEQLNILQYEHLEYLHKITQEHKNFYIGTIIY